MGPLSAVLLSAEPGWWYETWGTGRWLRTLFDQPIEVHTFELGALVGVVLASLVVRRRQRLALLVVLVVGLFTFGTLETVFACSDSFDACQHVRLKPWYFLGGFLAAHLLALGVFGGLAGGRSDDGAAVASVERPLAGLVVVGLLALAGYSFVSPEPVQPITGLATIGGFLGGGLGLAAYDWALGGERGSRFGASVGRVVRQDVDGAMLVVAYGTVLGFGYPRLFWELGVQTGQNDFLFGPIGWANAGMLSVVSYVFVVFLVGLVLLWRGSGEGRFGRFDGPRFAAFVLGYVVCVACLFVATGYAERLWYRLIPSAGL